MTEGVLVYWQAARGFGFLRPCRNHEGDFVHVSRMKAAGIEPVVGRWYSYQMGERLPGKPEAIDIAELTRAEPVKVGGEPVTVDGVPVTFGGKALTVEQIEALRVFG